MRALDEHHKTLEERRERLQTLLGTNAIGIGSSKTPDELFALAKSETERSNRLEQLLTEACNYVASAARCLWRHDGGDGGVPKVVAEAKCNVQSLDKWLQRMERQLFSMYAVVQTACSRDGELVPNPPLVLSDWCARERLHKVAKVTVPEIHEALCQQAAQQRRGGELEDDEEDVGEAERKEAEAKKSPFERKKVNKAQERQRIIDWARKRQPQAQASIRATETTATGGGSVRMSASAPALRAPGGCGPSVEARLSRRIEGGGAGIGGGSCILPAIGESSSRTAADRDIENGHVAGRCERPSAAEQASAYTAQYGAAAGGPSSAAAIHGGETGPGGRKHGGHRLRAAAHSSSMPGLGSSAPKDLGTVIYLLGTQSSSMNARRFLRPDS